MIIQIAWRNIWRNKLRSLVVIIAIMLGVFSGLFSTAFMQGMVDQRFDIAIKNEVSHIQLHHPEYRKQDNPNLYMQHTNEKIESILKFRPVKAISERVVTTAMILAAGTASGVKVVGIHPEKEMNVTNIHNKMIAGSYFGNTPPRVKPLVLGKKLADKLNVKIKSRIVLNLTDIYGNPVSGGFRVTGIYETNNDMFDGMMVFTRQEDMSSLLNMPPETCHEMSVLLTSNNQTDQVKIMLQSAFPDLEVATWKEISPELNYLMEIMNQYTYIIILIILLALCFGIINTMLMAVLERIKELGMLMAIGMNRRRVFSMIMAESVFLTLAGGLAGIFVGVLITIITAQTGIDLSMYGEGLKAIGWSSVIYPSITQTHIFIITIMVILTGIVSAIYPAYKALKFNPAESLRTK
jgi:ABC-type lipoprotein release transport system permease subunit